MEDADLLGSFRVVFWDWEQVKDPSVASGEWGSGVFGAEMAWSGCCW
jgi:hypothetical protein